MNINHNTHILLHPKLGLTCLYNLVGPHWVCIQGPYSGQVGETHTVSGDTRDAMQEESSPTLYWTMLLYAGPCWTELSCNIPCWSELYWNVVFWTILCYVEF
jgi:hypothetical protein